MGKMDLVSLLFEPSPANCRPYVDFIYSIPIDVANEFIVAGVAETHMLCTSYALPLPLHFLFFRFSH